MSAVDYEYFGYCPKEWEEALEQTAVLKDHEAGIIEIDGGTILPLRRIPGTVEDFGDGVFEGGLIDFEGKFIAGQFRSMEAPYSNRSIAQGYEIPDDVIVHEREETVIFGGMLVSHWGHMLVDATSRLWYPVMHPENHTKIVFVRFPGQRFPYQELLSLAGIEESRVEIIDEPTRFRKVIVPEETIHSLSGHYGKEWISFFDAVRKAVRPAPYKKIYLTRTAFMINNVCGEQYFEDFYAAQGYHVVAPEKYTITEQVAMIAGADELVTTMGTISHMVLFARPGTHLTILNRSHEIVRVQLTMNEARGIRCTYVDAYRNFLPSVQGGNSIFLLAPNKHWREYKQAVFGLLSDEKEDEEVFGRAAVDYIKKWGRFFGEKKHYKWIRNCEVKDLVAEINRTFLGKRGDTSKYLPTQTLENTRKELQQCELNAGCAILACLLEEAEGELLIEGKWSRPLCPPDGLTFCAWAEQYCPAKQSLPAEKNQFPLKIKAVYNVECGYYSWQIRTDLQTFCRNAETVNTYRIIVSVSNPRGQLVMPVIFPTHENYLLKNGFKRQYFSDDKLLGLQTSEKNELMFIFETADEALRNSASVSVQELCWEKDFLHIEGLIDSVLLNAPDFTIAGELRAASGKEVSTLSVPLVLQGKMLSDRVKQWGVSLNAAQILQCSGKNDSLRWDLFLSLQWNGAEQAVHLGLREDIALRERFTNYFLSEESGMLVPGFHTQGKMSLYFLKKNAAVSRFWIENLVWVDSELQMSGTIRWKLPEIAGEMDFLLKKSDNVVIYEQPLRLHPLAGKEQLWELAIPMAELVKFVQESENPQGTYSFFVRTAIGDSLVEWPVGNKRKPGSLAHFKQLPDSLREKGFSADTIGKEEYLGIRVEKKAPAPKSFWRRLW